MKKKKSIGQKLKEYEQNLELSKQKKEIKNRFERPERIQKRINKFLESKQKPGLRLKKQPRATLTIKEYQPEEYKSIYFKREYEQDKRNFFFK